jgi:flagellar biosynthesis protein FlhF
MEQAQQVIGAEAVVLSVQRIGSGSMRLFELTAADPSTAAGYRAERRPEPDRPKIPIDVGWEDAKVERAKRPIVLALVGPTGAGKTTTIAKLANHPDVFRGCAVGLICLDTYRVGGIEQARIYAEISGLPMEVAYESGEIEGVLRRLNDRAVLLVDTPGRGPRGKEDVASTIALIQRLRPSEVHLTIPAGLHPRQIQRQIAAYRPFGITHLLATKIDECPEDDGLFRIAKDQGLSVRWFTDGQEVPMDLCWTSRSRPDLIRELRLAAGLVEVG